MGSHISNFDTTAQFAAFSATTEYKTPHVTLIKEQGEVHYFEHDYSQDYFTFKAREQGTFKLTIGSAVTTSTLQSISYSTDNGETWNTTNNVNDQTVTITTPTVNQGGKVLWKGTGTAMSVATSSTAAADRPASSSIFSSTGMLDVKGNILSLIYGDNFADKDYVPEGSSSNFALLFYAVDTSNYAKVVSAKHLCLPAIALTDFVYGRMFQGCTNLTTAPELPATTLASDCNLSMFYGCTSLTEAPELPATNLSGANNCYDSMFYGRTSLTTAPELPATTLATRCYAHMFDKCASLTTTPELPATNLSGANNCYAFMFQRCTNLTTALDLPATTLAVSAYTGMFKTCTSLQTAPELLATNLSGANNCCDTMFANCTSLTTLPSNMLHATTMGYKCYQNMFRGCTSLKLLTVAPELPATTLAEDCYQQMFQDCTGLTTAPELPATTLAEGCYSCMFQGCTNLTTASELPATTLAVDCYSDMFNGCTSLTTAPELPAITMGYTCYQNMFKNCTSLNSIKCLATDISATDCTTDWVNGVAASGTFTKAASMSSWTEGTNGIPSGWTVVDA